VLHEKYKAVGEREGKENYIYWQGRKRMNEETKPDEHLQQGKQVTKDSETKICL